MSLCRHCRRRKANRARGLCWTCDQTPAVRALYPVTSKYDPLRNKLERHVEPTAEEIDALVAEQMKNLPEWWEQEKGK